MDLCCFIFNFNRAKAVLRFNQKQKEVSLGHSQEDIGSSSFLAPSSQDKAPKSNNDGWTLGQITVFFQALLCLQKDVL